MKYLNHETAELIRNKVTDTCGILLKKSVTTMCAESPFFSNNIDSAIVRVELNCLFDDAVAAEILEIANEALSKINAQHDGNCEYYIENVSQAASKRYDEDGNETDSLVESRAASFTIGYVFAPSPDYITKKVEYAYKTARVSGTSPAATMTFLWCGQDTRNSIIRSVKLSIQQMSQCKEYNGVRIRLQDGTLERMNTWGGSHFVRKALATLYMQVMFPLKTSDNKSTEILIDTVIGGSVNE